MSLSTTIRPGRWLPALLLLFAVAPMPARAAKPPVRLTELPGDVQRLVDRIVAIDNQVRPDFEAYHRTLDRTKEPQLSGMLAKRAGLHKALTAVVSRRVAVRKEAIAKLQAKMDKMGEVYDRLDSERAVKDMRARLDVLEEYVDVHRDCNEFLETTLKDLETLAAERAYGGIDELVGELPVAETGEWAGTHLVYDGDAYLATMDRSGRMQVQIKDPREKDTFLTPAIHFARLEIIGGERRTEPQKLLGYLECPAAAVQQPRRLVLGGLVEGNVEFRIVYQFEREGITVATGYADPLGIEHPARLAFDTAVGPIDGDDAMDEAQKKKAYGKYYLKLKTGGERLKMPFTEEKVEREIDSVDIAGPWKSRKVRIKVKGIDNKDLDGWQRTAFTLKVVEFKSVADGFTISYTTGNNKIKGIRTSISLRIQ
ncbi:MAG: hypothetical protein QGF67_13155 [Lentisphaeria bacterium]|jgi:hypothetical protein|nr:hypothetical protein [Lentisphaeria bacterium]